MKERKFYNTLPRTLPIFLLALLAFYWYKMRVDNFHCVLMINNYGDIKVTKFCHNKHYVLAIQTVLFLACNTHSQYHESVFLNLSRTPLDLETAVDDSLLPWAPSWSLSLTSSFTVCLRPSSITPLFLCSFFLPLPLPFILCFGSYDIDMGFLNCR